MRLVDVDVLLSQMDNRYIEKENIVPDTLAEGFMQMDKLINQQDVFDLSKHDSELLDKVEKVVKNRINSYNPSYTDIYNVITELSDVVLNGIAELKAEVEK